MTVEQIMDYQSMLKANGFYTGAIDGVIGPQTIAAANAMLASDAGTVTDALTSSPALRDAISSISVMTGLTYGTDSGMSTLSGGGTEDVLLYLVVGSPPNYTVVAVSEGEDGYQSGMTKEAADATAAKLNADYVPPSASDDTVTTVDDAETADPNFFDVDARYNDEYSEPDLNMNSVLSDIATRFPYFPTNVLEEYAMNYIDSGDDAVAMRKTEASQVFKQAFPGIRREDGTMRYTVGEYLGVKEDMRVQVAEYGLNPEIFETQFNKLIEGDVAPVELARRLEQVQAQIGNNIPAVQQAFAAQFGVPLSAEAILAAVVSPEIEEGLLSGTITAAQVQGEAIAAGFQTSFARSQALARAGLTQQQAAQTYQFGKTAMDLAARAGREFVLADVEEASVGDVEAAKRVSAILAEVESQSSSRAGARKSQTGAVTGLTEA